MPITVRDGEARVRDWQAIREPLERQLAPLGRHAIRALALRPGERVLDIGCGVGGTPAELARLVGPAGAVLGVDPLGPAVDAMRADPGRPEQLRFLCADAGSHPFAPASFDAAFSRFGAMFFEDPAAAFANVAHALRPGGRLAFVCWRGFAENELDHLPLRAASLLLPPELVERATTAPCFSLADPARVRRVLAGAGFADVRAEARDEAVGTGDVESTLDVCSRVGALGASLRDRPDLRGPAVAALRRALPDGPEPQLRAATWLVTARVPGG